MANWPGGAKESRTIEEEIADLKEATIQFLRLALACADAAVVFRSFNAVYEALPADVKEQLRRDA